MSLNSANVNIGHLQGIIVGEIYSPRSSIALVTLKVKADRSTPGTSKRKLHFIQIVAYDELAEQLRENGTEGRILYVQYHLTTNGKKDENGVSRFFNNRTADKLFFGQMLNDEPVSVPYLNKGFIQGNVAGLKRIYGSDANLWSLLVSETLVHDSGREMRHLHRFVIDGDEMKFLAGRKKNGEPVLAEYRVESRKETRNGQTEHHTDYILTNLL